MILLKLKTYHEVSIAENPLHKRNVFLRVAIRLALEIWAAALIAICPLVLYYIFIFSDVLLHPKNAFPQYIQRKPDVSAVVIISMICWGFVKLLPHGAEWVKSSQTLARRFTVIDAERAMINDTRAPILYLRSFIDRFTDNDIWAQPESDENLILPVLREVGPVIAIGQPGETLPPLGAARLYLDNSCDWQTTVIDYFTRSKIIVISPSYSAGVIWEASKAFQLCPPEKIIISLISLKPELNYSKSHNDYKLFRDMIKMHNNIQLPEDVGDSLFIHFTSDWKPRLAGAGTDRRNSRFIEATVRVALQTLLQNKGIHVRREMPLGWHASNAYQWIIKSVAVLIPIITTIRYALLVWLS